MVGPAIKNDEIARRLGFSELRVGSHDLPGLPEGRWIRINAFWVLTAIPSFAHGWKVGALATEDVVDRMPSFAHKYRGFFATDEFVESAELPSDPLRTAFQNFNPFEAVFPTRELLGDGQWRVLHTVDGIVYEMEWHTLVVRGGQFRFGNPRNQPMIDLERRWYKLAQEIERLTKNNQIEECLKLWREHRH